MPIELTLHMSIHISMHVFTHMRMHMPMHCGSNCWMLQHSVNKIDWNLHEELERYLCKLPAVAAACRLSRNEETQAIYLCGKALPHVKNREQYLRQLTLSADRAELRGSNPRLGGQQWSVIQHTSDALLVQCKRVHKLALDLSERAAGGVLLDDAAVAIIFDREMLDDTESGSSRQLGFLLLYQLLTKALSVQINGVECGNSMGSVLTQLFNLKLMRWGQGWTAETTEVASWHMLVLQVFVAFLFLFRP